MCVSESMGTFGPRHTAPPFPYLQLACEGYLYLPGSLRVSRASWRIFRPTTECCAFEQLAAPCFHSEGVRARRYDQCDALHTFILLLSLWSSRHSFSNFSFKPTVLLNSARFASRSFCRASARFLIFIFSFSRRRVSASSSLHRFVTWSIFSVSSILEVCCWRSRNARLTSRSVNKKISRTVARKYFERLRAGKSCRTDLKLLILLTRCILLQLRNASCQEP